jgi:hypothetical protein
MRFFLFLLLVPSLIYASFNERDCEKLMAKVTAEWNRHAELIVQFKALRGDEKERQVALLQESINCCVKALGYCDKILNKIASKSKKERYDVPWPKVKEMQTKERQIIQNELDGLQQVLNNLIASDRASLLFAESERKAALAYAKNGQYQAAPPDNANDAICIFNEIASLFEAAARDATDAFSALCTIPSDTGESKAFLQQRIAEFRHRIKECQEVIEKIQNPPAEEQVQVEEFE